MLYLTRATASIRGQIEVALLQNGKLLPLKQGTAALSARHSEHQRKASIMSQGLLSAGVL